MPESNIPLQSACAGLVVIVNYASLERTKEQFEDLLMNQGLELE